MGFLLSLQVLSEAERERSRASSAEQALAQRETQLQQLQEQTTRLSTALESSQKMAEKVGAGLVLTSAAHTKESSHCSCAARCFVSA